MAYEEVPDFYAILKIPRNADNATIEAALQAFEQQTRERLNITHLMRSSGQILSDLLPLMRRALLLERDQYDQHLQEDEQKRMQTRELHDGPRLDERFRSPFFFDRYGSIDTEVPAHTLREMVEKVDRAWVQARTWLTNAPLRGKKHRLLWFLKHNALQNDLALQIEQEVIQHIAVMNADEALERFLYLINPEIKRPSLAVNGVPIKQNQQQTVYIGQLLPDEATQGTLTLTHMGKRGCVFGTVESLTDWVKLAAWQPTAQFWLLPESKQPGETAAFRLPLHINGRSLARNTLHKATLVFHIDNYDPPRDIVVQLATKILALPPSVTFEPPSTRTAPLYTGAVKHGTQIRTTITPHNNGDETIIPLVARLHCHDSDVEIDPAIIHSDEPVTITMHTQNKIPDTSHAITVSVDYSHVRGAKGAENIYIHYGILPTPWQSMLHEKPLDERAKAALAMALPGTIIGLIMVFTTRWLPVAGFVLLPLLLLGLVHLFAKTLTWHKKQAGEPPLPGISQFWLIPIVVGILLALVFLTDINTAYLLGAIIGALFGCAAGLIADQTLVEAPIQPPVLGQPNHPQSMVMEQRTRRPTRSLH